MFLMEDEKEAAEVKNSNLKMNRSLCLFCQQSKTVANMDQLQPTAPYITQSALYIFGA